MMNVSFICMAVEREEARAIDREACCNFTKTLQNWLHVHLDGPLSSHSQTLCLVCNPHLDSPLDLLELELLRGLGVGLNKLEHCMTVSKYSITRTPRASSLR